MGAVDPFKAPVVSSLSVRVVVDSVLLRSVILKARRLADNHAEQERATAAAKTWLLAQIEKKRTAPAADRSETAPDKLFIPERLAA
jgi:hypothetical protein